jgi:hypothetical protein
LAAHSAEGLVEHDQPDDHVERPRIRVTPAGLADPQNAAVFLGLKVKTLANWRSEGRGPPWVKIGGRVRYPFDGLQKAARGEAA